MLHHFCLPQVSFHHNRPAVCKQTKKLALRYTFVVTADPGAAQLSREEKQAVQQLLNNNDEQHRTVIGANLRQTVNFLTAVEQQLTPPPEPAIWGGAQPAPPGY